MYRLPSIESEGVIGMLGPNGMGKSTALSVLAGTRQPNLGDWEIDSAAWDDIIQSVPSGLVREHMVRVSAGESSVSMKP
ncbi:MAG: ribosome biogenesis/translation initiation ATPase RLI, partial [Euryarchaeota archaeon]|nr:ribosome biogenesis/translation initiation ATPase RLI [Euryarchaeota archaeon]